MSFSSAFERMLVGGASVEVPAPISGEPVFRAKLPLGGTATLTRLGAEVMLLTSVPPF